MVQKMLGASFFDFGPFFSLFFNRSFGNRFCIILGLRECPFKHTIPFCCVVLFMNTCIRGPSLLDPYSVVGGVGYPSYFPFPFVSSSLLEHLLCAG